MGTPQGGVISPLLANIFLHYVVDQWVHTWRASNAKGDVIIVRYADDVVMGFQYQSEARKCHAALGERLATFNLELHAQKTRLIEFGRFSHRDRAARGEGKPEAFDFLGITHICGRTRTNGCFTIRRKPVSRRIARKLKQIKGELIARRHEAVSDQGKWLRSVFQGMMRYYGVPGTAEILGTIRKQLVWTWLRSLRRRSHKARQLTWQRMEGLINTWIPKVRICHPYPSERLVV